MEPAGTPPLYNFAISEIWDKIPNRKFESGYLAKRNWRRQHLFFGKALVMTKPIEQTWGYAPQDVYVDRWNMISGHIRGPRFVLVDWGSDAGWFSIKIACDFPQATVISVESGIMSNGKGIKLHEEHLNTHKINNNIVVNNSFGPDTFAGLCAVPSDYQLVLSVFHHIRNRYGGHLKGVIQWDNALCDLVTGSNVTFIELPNENSPHETPHQIRNWYSGRDIETVLLSALKRNGIRATVELLGGTSRGVKGCRKLFKIALDEPVVTAPSDEIARYINLVGQGICFRQYHRARIVLRSLVQKL